MQADPGLPHPQPTPAFWQSPPHHLSDARSENLPERAATVVIGSGITACSLVKALLERDPNAEVLLVEGRGLTSGATGRNGGHLVSSAVADFLTLQQHFGTSMAVKIASFTLANVERVFEVARECGAEVEGAAEIRRVDKVLALRDVAKVESLKKSLESFEQHMPEKWKGQLRLVEKSSLEEKYRLRNIAGGAVGKAGALWPYRLITRAWSLLQEKYPKQLRIETWTPVTSVSSAHEDEYPYLVKTSRGAVKAKEVVYCTNGHTGHLIPALRGKLFPFRGTMTVQSCGPAFPNEGDSRAFSFYGSGSFSSDTKAFDLGLHYMQQNARTGDVFIGGETEDVDGILNSDDSQISPRSLKTLETILPVEFASDVWKDGEGPKVESSWSGIMGFTADGVPLVGQLPKIATGREEGGEWIAAGFNGYGMANCWLSGEAVAGMMRGEDVTEWLPECYLATPERLRSIDAQKGAFRLFVR
ncbi:FAD dependent oxidoreductase [Macrophomina phaseolina]|uniref:FAD dependent oxidoreductase n=1 Tax=Macrophomina phaseolina TaxID=35725 RepID=A0ABQ8GNI5_9PEZI|nr:FAD dependent oxidoreductase [Macrophomina phaseolina]